MILYSNNKTEDYTLSKCLDLKKRGINGIICDFQPDAELTKRLNFVGINNNYYRMQLYSYLPKDTSNILIDLWNEILRATTAGFKGFALDLEPYSNSLFWQYVDFDYYSLGLEIGQCIKKHFNHLIIYPEFLGNYKYGDIPEETKIPTYIKFVRGLYDSKININIILERTYQEWIPWKLLFFRWRAKYELSINVDYYTGIWPDKLNKFCAFIQRLFSGKNIFYYTEEKI